MKSKNENKVDKWINTLQKLVEWANGDKKNKDKKEHRK